MYIYRTREPITEFKLFSSIHQPFIKIDHNMCHKQVLTRFKKKKELCKTKFLKNSEMILGINSTEIPGKSLNICKNLTKTIFNP